MRAVFVTGTDTDIGKTYVSALMCKTLVKQNLNVGYYKAAISGADNIKGSDAGYVKDVAGLKQSYESLLSYLYQDPLSPHLAARLEKRFVDLKKVKDDFNQVAALYDYVLMEGSGGIVCPIVYERYNKILLEDIVKLLGLSVVVVADAGLGTINQTTLCCHYLNSKGIKVNGIILNNFDENKMMHQDNLMMIEDINKVKVIATVASQSTELSMRINSLTDVFSSITKF